MNFTEKVLLSLLLYALSWVFLWLYFFSMVLRIDGRTRTIFAWYDLWAGLYIDRAKRVVYLFPVPCFGLCFHYGRDVDLMSKHVDPRSTITDDDRDEAAEEARLDFETGAPIKRNPYAEGSGQWCIYNDVYLMLKAEREDADE